jgi:hypothetical protein
MMRPALASEFQDNRVLEIAFREFTSRLTFLSDQRVTTQVVAGDNAGFSDTVNYEAVWFSDSILVLSWRERIGTTVVHVLDLASSEAYTLVTPMKGSFMRLQGHIKWGGPIALVRPIQQRVTLAAM